MSNSPVQWRIDLTVGDPLDGQAVVVIGRWYSRQPLKSHKWSLFNQTIPEIVAPKAITHSTYIFGNGCASKREPWS